MALGRRNKRSAKFVEGLAVFVRGGVVQALELRVRWERGRRNIESVQLRLLFASSSCFLRVIALLSPSEPSLRLKQRKVLKISNVEETTRDRAGECVVRWSGFHRLPANCALEDVVFTFFTSGTGAAGVSSTRARLSLRPLGIRTRASVIIICERGEFV